MVRAHMTYDEWARLRKLAIDEGIPSSHIVGRLIRDFVQEHDPQPRRKRAQ